MTSDDLSHWRCHCCEPADSKMAEIQLMAEVKCRASDKCVSSPLSRTYTVYVHTHTYAQVLLSPSLFFLMSCWVASPAQKSHSLSLFPLLIQGDKVTPVTSKMLPNLWLWPVKLPSVFGKYQASILLFQNLILFCRSI